MCFLRRTDGRLFFVASESLVQPLTSFCQQTPEGISHMSVSCFLTEPGPSPSQPQPGSKPREDEGGGRKGWETSECGKGAEVIENCVGDCSNPVISPAKAGHSTDQGAEMLSCLCLSFHSSTLYLALFSRLHWMSEGGLGSVYLSSHSLHTHRRQFHIPSEQKGFFSSCSTWTSRPSPAS